MTKESMEWLNQFTLVGYTAVRGNAWTYVEALQGTEPNHYEDAIPVDDVVRRLFDFEVKSQPLFIHDHTGHLAPVPDRQAMVAGTGAPFPGEVFGIFKDGYQGHAYKAWLLENASNILHGGELGIGQAGLLRKGAQAWVSFELPENFKAGDVEFRPQLLATTSFDGSTATTYKLVSTIVVCDNTRAAALREGTPTFRLKHTRFSGGKVQEAREALGLILDAKDDIQAEIEQLLDTEVTNKQFSEIVDRVFPLPEDLSKPSRGLTIAINKRDAVKSLYSNDQRVAPWAGTGWGVAQAFNTFQHHIASVKGATRVERNKANALGNQTAANDDQIRVVMNAVLAAA